MSKKTNPNVNVDSILAVSAAIKKKGPRVDKETYDAHVPDYVSRDGSIYSSSRLLADSENQKLLLAFREAKNTFEGNSHRFELVAGILQHQIENESEEPIDSDSPLVKIPAQIIDELATYLRKKGHLQAVNDLDGFLFSKQPDEWTEYS